MSGSIFKQMVLPAALILVGLTVIVALTGPLERARPQLPPDYGDTDLNLNGSRLKGFAFGMEGLIADWYWMRSLQYIGEKLLSRTTGNINIDDLRDLNPRLLYPFLDNATDLDPHFIVAYSYGAVVLPAIDPEKAVALASKGIARNPGEWRLYQHLGYIYWKLGRYELAAETYEKGSAIPGSSPFMKLMAASMKTQGGSRSTARAIYREMLHGSSDEQVRITATKRLQQLEWFDQQEAIDQILADLKTAKGKCPDKLNEILPMLTQVRLPEGGEFRLDNADRLVDPGGAPYLLDKESCRVRLDPERTQLPK